MSSPSTGRSRPPPSRMPRKGDVFLRVTPTPRTFFTKTSAVPSGPSDLVIRRDSERSQEVELVERRAGVEQLGVAAVGLGHAHPVAGHHPAVQVGALAASGEG